MSHANVANWTLADYERAAREYCASLPPEHFMESVGQSTQRKVSWHSLDYVALRRGRMQVLNELLVQYPRNGGLGQVVPDNAVVRNKRKLKSASSYNIAFEALPLFWALEYASRSNWRKDYEGSFLKYQDDLKILYYLLFDPDTLDLRLFRHNGLTYDYVRPNEHGRLAVPELEVEVALLDGWVRFWYQGELVPLPEDLVREIDELREQLDEARTQVVLEKRRADRLARLAEQEKQRVKQEKQRTLQARQAADRQTRLAEQERQRAEQQTQRAESAEEELSRLRALLERIQNRGGSGPSRKK